MAVPRLSVVLLGTVMALAPPSVTVAPVMPPPACLAVILVLSVILSGLSIVAVAPTELRVNAEPVPRPSVAAPSGLTPAPPTRIALPVLTFTALPVLVKPELSRSKAPVPLTLTVITAPPSVTAPRPTVEPVTLTGKVVAPVKVVPVNVTLPAVVPLTVSPTLGSTVRLPIAAAPAGALMVPPVPVQ